MFLIPVISILLHLADVYSASTATDLDGISEPELFPLPNNNHNQTPNQSIPAPLYPKTTTTPSASSTITTPPPPPPCPNMTPSVSSTTVPASSGASDPSTLAASATPAAQNHSARKPTRSDAPEPRKKNPCTMSVASTRLSTSPHAPA